MNARGAAHPEPRGKELEMFPLFHPPGKKINCSAPAPSPFTAALCGFTCGAVDETALLTVLEAVRPFVKTKILSVEGFQDWLLKTFWTGSETPEYVARQWEETGNKDNH